MLEKKNMAPLTVLISVYAGERTCWLKESLRSIFSQTLRASEVLLLEDGPLTDELDKVVSFFQSLYPELRVICYPENRGLGKTLNDGLLECKNEIVARMDSDDISIPERFEVEYNWLVRHPDYSLVGSWTNEFSGLTKNIRSQRKVPEDFLQIIQYAKRRCPVNHPTVMFRKSAVLDAGGYLTKYFPEDYFLWIRMLQRGDKFYNIQRSLLFFRFSQKVINRRGGWRYAKDEALVQYHIYQTGFITFHVFIENIIVRGITRLVPTSIRTLIYRFIRKS